MEENETQRNDWVVQMQEIINATTQAGAGAVNGNTRARFICRVPAWMTGTRSSRAYWPQVVSLGPFHHDSGNLDLLLMEEYKTQAMLRLVRRSGKPVKEFVDAIDAKADELQSAYDGLDDKWQGPVNRGKFVQMMATDGCFLLEMALGVYNAARPGKRAPGFQQSAYRDTQALSIWESIRQDVVAIENQLPLLVLQTLESVRQSRPVTDEYINDLVLTFISPLERRPSFQGVLGLHPLDILHKSYCRFGQNHQEPNQDDPPSPQANDDPENKGAESCCVCWPCGGTIAASCPGSNCCSVCWSWCSPQDERLPSALEISQAGITFKRSRTNKLDDIEFKGGCCPELHMPLFKVGYDTKIYLLNMIALEKLDDRTRKVTTSYLYFMNKIIKTRADAALLRSKGLIDTSDSDDAVADLFNTLYTGLPTSPWSLQKVQDKVNAHCKNNWNFARCCANFAQTYMSDPLVFTSFLAAVLLLLLTIAQTVYTIYPYYHPRT